MRLRRISFLLALLATACAPIPANTAPNAPSPTAALPSEPHSPKAATEVPASETPPPTPMQAEKDMSGAIIFQSDPDRKDFVAMGLVHNGKWLSPDDAPELPPGPLEYGLYTPFDSLGIFQASRLHHEGICNRNFLTIDAPGASEALVGTSGDWSVLPRPPQELPNDTPVYQKTVADWLIEQAPSQPIVNISRIWRVDIEGDGTDEVFINASRFAEPSGHNVGPRDYSVVLMRKVSGNSVVTIRVVGDYYSEAATNRFPSRYSLAFIGDLNGDGRLEVLVGVSRWEGAGATIYEIQGTQVTPVLAAMCSL